MRVYLPTFQTCCTSYPITSTSGTRAVLCHMSFMPHPQLSQVLLNTPRWCPCSIPRSALRHPDDLFCHIDVTLVQPRTTRRLHALMPHPLPCADTRPTRKRALQTVVQCTFSGYQGFFKKWFMVESEFALKPWQFTLCISNVCVPRDTYIYIYIHIMYIYIYIYIYWGREMCICVCAYIYIYIYIYTYIYMRLPDPPRQASTATSLSGRATRPPAPWLV